jgi:hypothetical protein
MTEHLKMVKDWLEVVRDNKLDDFFLGQQLCLSQVVEQMEKDKCKWTHNNDRDRWDTSCDDLCVALNDETPKDFGFKICPYCGKSIEWTDEQGQQEPTPEQIDSCCLWYRHDFGLLPDDVKNKVRDSAKEWLRAWRKVGM